MALVIEHDRHIMPLGVAVDYGQGKGMDKLQEGNPDGFPSEFQRFGSC